VRVVTAAVGIGIWAASKLTISKVTAGFGGRTGSSWARVQRLNCGERNKGEGLGSLHTLSLGEVASVPIRAAVRVIAAAVGVGVWAASKLTISKIAAGFGGRTGSSWARVQGFNGFERNKGEGLRSLYTLSLGKIASVSVRAAVRVIAAAVSVGIWAASKLTIS